MVQIIRICSSKRVSPLKSLALALLVVWHFPLNAVFANSGSYIAGQFAEKEGDFSNASYYYIDLIARGETEREIIKRSIIYSALSGNFEVATAISRKINDLELNYPVANLIIFAESVKNKENRKILESFERHKKSFPAIFQSVAEFWILINNDEKDKAFKLINSLSISNEAQMQIINYNQLLAYVYFNEYELAKTLYENMSFSDFLFDSESALALLEYFQKDRESKVYESIVKKVRVASDNSYYILALMDRLSFGEEVNSIKINPYKQIAEVFFRWSQSLPLEGKNSINKPFYLSLANYADPNSSFLKFKAATVLFDTGNYTLSKEILDRFSKNDLFYMDSIVEKTYAIEQIDSDKTALEYIEKFIIDGFKNARLLKTYGSLQRSQRLYKEAIKSYTGAIEAAKRELHTESLWPIFFLRGISFERSKDWILAEADFISALELSPNQPQILNYMGYSLLERKEKLDQAMRMISLAAEKAPNSYHIIDSLGWAHYKSGEFEKALLYLEKAMELESTDPIVNDHLGDVLWMLGRKREAQFQWKKSLSFKPEPSDQKNTEDKLLFGLKLR
ncbi:tetratricopeptide repeat protein [Paracoccaceae bacterium]|nr:tetratricopeptide repeat protein [Paracoccaceae bacterium]